MRQKKNITTVLGEGRTAFFFLHVGEFLCPVKISSRSALHSDKRHIHRQRQPNATYFKAYSTVRVAARRRVTRASPRVAVGSLLCPMTYEAVPSSRRLVFCRLHTPNSSRRAGGGTHTPHSQAAAPSRFTDAYQGSSSGSRYAPLSAVCITHLLLSTCGACAHCPLAWLREQALDTQRLLSARRARSVAARAAEHARTASRSPFVSLSGSESIWAVHASRWRLSACCASLSTETASCLL